MKKILLIEINNDDNIEERLQSVFNSSDIITLNSITANQNNSCKFKDEEQLLSVKDVMEYLHIGKDTAYELFNSKKLKTIKVGRQQYIMKRDFMDYIEKLSVKKTTFAALKSRLA